MYNFKNSKIKITSKLGIGIFISAFLLLSNPMTSSGGMVVFAGKIFWKMPSSFCLEPLTCSATCAPCGCGPFSANLILPIYGTAPGSVTFLCQGVGAAAFGTSPMLLPGSTVFGKGASPWVFFNDGVANNLWGQFQ